MNDENSKLKSPKVRNLIGKIPRQLVLLALVIYVIVFVLVLFVIDFFFLYSEGIVERFIGK